MRSWILIILLVLAIYCRPSRNPLNAGSFRITGGAPDTALPVKVINLPYITTDNAPEGWDLYADGIVDTTGWLDSATFKRLYYYDTICFYIARPYADTSIVFTVICD